MSIPDNQLGEAVSRLAATLLPRESLGSTLETVAQLTCQTIPTCHASSISLVEPGGQVTTTAATNDLARQLDAQQYRTGEGPCLEAIRTGAVVRVGDLRADCRFAQFGARAVEFGAQSALALPLLVRGEAIGGLNLYGETPNCFDQDDQNAAERLAMQGAVVVANAAAYDQAARLVQQLQTALLSRAEIEQAKGIIMARSRVDPDEAFQLLRRRSQHENVKLRDVARRIVAAASAKATTG